MFISRFLGQISKAQSAVFAGAHHAADYLLASVLQLFGSTDCRLVLATSIFGALLALGQCQALLDLHGLNVLRDLGHILRHCFVFLAS